MTDKEVHKLRRHELIDLLLREVLQVDHFKEVAVTIESENQQLQDTIERIKGRLNDKDAQIERLKKKA